jgi:L-ascorbate metabolism protein UlaG (beta-lactamase superfamily)
MKAEVTYIFHNCFVLKISGAGEEQTFLFDYPADQYLNEVIKATVISKISNTDLYILSSHNHHDHFNRNVENLGAFARSATYLLSKDIIKKNRKFREMERAGESCYTIEPDQTYHIKDLEVHSFLSNDEGVAFLLNVGRPPADNLTVYFGGDLANWDWDDLNKQERQFLVDYFGEVLAKLNNWPIQIAFSNTDARLRNWAGAVQFIETIKPRLFIPMHTFGDTATIVKFLGENPHLGTEIFKYFKTGDTLTFEF